MADNKIPNFKIYWDEEDVNAMVKVIEDEPNWAVGPEIIEFEGKIAKYLGVKYCLTFNSGTSALHAILLAYGIGEGDEIIVPAFTFIATANAALFVGAKPIFAEIEPETLGLDPNDVRKKISSKTKAIIPVHIAGCPCRIDELSKIAKSNDLILIEDAAESFGACFKGEKIGTFGNAAILSFCQNKVITTGEGGAVVTNSDVIFNKLKLIRSQGRLDKINYFSSSDKPDYISLGYNFRMSSITAALGISQLNKIDRLIEKRRQNSRYITSKLVNISEIETPVSSNDFYHVYQMYIIKIKNNLREGLIEHLTEKQILTKVNFFPIHQTQFYHDNLAYDCKLPITEKISQEVLTLPMYPSLSEEDMNYITDEIKYFFSFQK